MTSLATLPAYAEEQEFPGVAERVTEHETGLGPEIEARVPVSPGFEDLDAQGDGRGGDPQEAERVLRHNLLHGLAHPEDALIGHEVVVIGRAEVAFLLQRPRWIAQRRTECPRQWRLVR